MLTQETVETILTRLRGDMETLFPQDKVEAVLFGSYARGDEDDGSDIDVLVLVDASRQTISQRNWRVGELAAEYLLDYGVVVSPIVENRTYYNTNAEALPFFRNIQREGVRHGA